MPVRMDATTIAGHDTHHDTKDCQETAELFGPVSIERHFQDFEGH